MWLDCFPKVPKFLFEDLFSEFFFKISRMIQNNKYKKITEAKFPKEVLSQMGKIDSSVTQNYISFIFYLHLEFFQILHHDRAQ